MSNVLAGAALEHEVELLQRSRGFSKESKHTRLSEETLAITRDFRVRLAGTLGHTLEEDFAAINALEKRISLDMATLPEKITEYAMLKSEQRHAEANDVLDFVRSGLHLRANSVERLMKVYRDGVVLLLTLPQGEGEELAGYHYSFTNLPSKDFPSLSPYDPGLKSLPAQLHEIISPAKRHYRKDDPEVLYLNGKFDQKYRPRLLTNWRTGIAPENQRRGFGALIKLIMFQLAARLKFEAITLNVGSLQFSRNGHLDAAPNKASSMHVSEFMIPGGMRQHTDSVIEGEPGTRIDMFWQIHVNLLESAIAEFRRSNGILVGKGYDLASVDAIVEKLWPDVLKHYLETRKPSLES